MRFWLLTRSLRGGTSDRARETRSWLGARSWLGSSSNSILWDFLAVIFQSHYEIYVLAGNASLAGNTFLAGTPPIHIPGWGHVPGWNLAPGRSLDTSLMGRYPPITLWQIKVLAWDVPLVGDIFLSEETSSLGIYSAITLWKNVLVGKGPLLAKIKHVPDWGDAPG